MASDNKTVVVQGGLGLPTILFLIFLVMQLCGAIDWPWYAVAAPLLISWGLGLAFIVLFLIIGLIGAIANR